MKKNLNILVLLLAVVLMGSCGKKENKNEEDTTISNADAPVVMDEDAKKEARRLKHERLEKIRAEKEKTRNDAYLETVKKSPTFKDESGEVVYNKAEVSPEFIGGQQAMNTWLSENLRYPQEAKDAEKEGTVFVDFIVGADGKVRNVTAESDMIEGEEVDQSLRMEAMRAVSAMPTWKPATEHGKKVAVKYSVPINFMLQ